MKPEDWVIPSSELEETLMSFKDLGYIIKITVNGEEYTIDWNK